MSRAAEINYYEELGVAQDASPEQIREAFRALVRLLHPDHQTDRQLKDIAESQMRKINRIYSVLSDAERRRRYDDALEEEDRAPTIVFSPQRGIAVSSRLLERICWLGAVLVLVAVLIWLGSDPPAVAPLQSVEQPANPPHAGTAARTGSDSAAEILQLRSQLRTLTLERDEAFRELTKLRGPVPHARFAASTPPPESPAVAAPQPALSTMTELPASPTHAAPAPLSAAAPPPKPAQKQFAGFWFYTKPALGQQNKNRSLYPPEFIEASITEQNGTVHGRYRSRYRIVDRAISPDVNFEFTGTANGGTLKCPFAGPGGARGELTIQLTAENAMSVEWSATELGSMQGLSNGTAKLTRRVDQ